MTQFPIQLLELGADNATGSKLDQLDNIFPVGQYALGNGDGVIYVDQLNSANAAVVQTRQHMSGTRSLDAPTYLGRFL
jgi:hypothetical protein